MSPSSPEPVGRPPRTPAPAWLHGVAVAGAAFTWPLLLVGGVVSVHRVGMAVPDWPTTFQSNMFLYDLFEAPFGPFAEHTHRLYGAAVGLACIALAGFFTFARSGVRGLLPFGVVVAATVLAIVNPPGTLWGMSRAMAGLWAVSLVSLAYGAYVGLYRRDRVLGLVWFLIAAVCGQGVLGGIRVTQSSRLLAFVHGCTAQLFFGLMVVVVVLTGRPWLESRPRALDSSRMMRRGTVTLGMLLVQLVAGTYVRHFGSGLAVIIHAVLALAVLGHVVPLSYRVRKAGEALDFLRSSSGWMAVFSIIQVVLGVTAWWILRPFDGIERPVSPVQATIRIAHQGVGALLLASVVAFVMMAARRLGGPEDEGNVRDVHETGRNVEVVT
jgi:cytochrome c oxidase assembly protein subunit 15